MMTMSAFLGSSKKATIATTVAPRVAPIIGIRPRKPTATASTAANCSPMRLIMIQAKNALIAATATWPMAYDPTRRMTSSAREAVRGRRLLDRGQGGEEVEREHEHRQAAEDAGRDDLAGVEDATEDACPQVAVR